MTLEVDKIIQMTIIVIAAENQTDLIRRVSKIDYCNAIIDLLPLNCLSLRNRVRIVILNQGYTLNSIILPPETKIRNRFLEMEVRFDSESSCSIINYPFIKIYKKLGQKNNFTNSEEKQNPTMDLKYEC